MDQLAELRVLYQERDVEKGATLYGELVRTGVIDPELHLLGARLHRLAGNLWAALRALDQAKAGCPQGVILGQVLFTRGYLLREIGAPAEAIEQLEECDERFPEYSELGSELLGPLWYNLALALRQAKRYDEAISANRQAASHFRQASMATYLCMCLHNLAWVSCMRGHWDEARDALTEAQPLCCTEQLRHHQALGQAYLEATGPGCNLIQVMEGCMELLQQADGLPPDVASHACWLAGKMALELQLFDKAMLLADMAVHYGAKASGESRCLQDASDLRRDLTVAMGLIRKPAGS